MDESSNRDTSSFVLVVEDSTVIVAGSVYSLPLTTERSNVVLRWEFESDEYSVLFGIAKVDAEDENNTLRYLNSLSDYLPNVVHQGERTLEALKEFVEKNRIVVEHPEEEL